MSELIPCPFCNVNDWRYQSHFSGASIFQCGGCGTIVDESVINTRPIEDGLRARVAELEAENERLQDAWFRDETICPDGSLKPKVSDLLTRIYELEGKEADRASSMHAIMTILDVDNKISETDDMYQAVHELAYELRARVAELEAEVAELKPYRDGYDPEKVFPPEGEWVWLRDCDDNVEMVQYNQWSEAYWNYEPHGLWFRYNGDIVRWYPIGPLPELPEEGEG